MANNDGDAPIGVDVTDVDEQNTDTVDGETTEGKSVTFQTRVFHETDKQVYGAEVIIFEGEEEIDKILITDQTDFEQITNLLNLIMDAYPPYTTEVEEAINFISKYLAEDSAYRIEHEAEYIEAKKVLDNIKDNKYPTGGSLLEILDNNTGMDWSEETRRTYYDNNSVVINATHLNNLTAGDFARTNHTHDGYLRTGHEDIKGVNGQYGHTVVIDNLTTTDGSGAEALSAKQGKVLNEKISSVEQKLNNGWSKTITADKNGYVNYKVNEALHLVSCNYNRANYTGLKSKTGTHDLHNEGTIPKKYCPVSRVITPLYRGDVTLYYDTDGSIHIYNLTKFDAIGVHANVLWKY